MSGCRRCGDAGGEGGFEAVARERGEGGRTSKAFSNCSHGHGSQLGYAVSAAASLYAPGMPWYATLSFFFSPTAASPVPPADLPATAPTPPAPPTVEPRDATYRNASGTTSPGWTGEGTFLERAGPAVTDAIPAARRDAILALSPDGAIAREPNALAAPSRRRTERPAAGADGRVDARGTCIAHIATVIVSSTLPARQLWPAPEGRSARDPSHHE